MSYERAQEREEGSRARPRWLRARRSAGGSSAMVRPRWGREEEGVVAEAASAARRGEDEALDRAFGGVEDFAIAGEGERAAVTGLAAGFGDAGEGGEEGGVVAVVGRVGVGGVGRSAANRALRTPGALSRAATSKPESSARTRRLGAEGVVDGLGAGVGLEGGPVLGRGGDGGEAREGFDADGGRGRGGADEVAELAGIGCGGVEDMG